VFLISWQVVRVRSNVCYPDHLVVFQVQRLIGWLKKNNERLTTVNQAQSTATTALQALIHLRRLTLDD
jgi:predicted site-specific integrase-resolvase